MIIRPTALAWLVLYILISTTLVGAVANDTQIRITLENKDQIRQLSALGLDIVWIDPTFVEIFTNPAQADSLRQLGFKIETVHESVRDFYRSRLPQKDMGGYKTLAEINAYLDAMIAAHPDIVSTKQSIGTTIEGRDIWAVKISDNPNVDEVEPEVLFTAAIHAREVATPEILLHYMDYLTTQYPTNPEVQALVDGREIWFILNCNPDGYYYNQVIAPGGLGNWRMNRRDNGNGTYGVDINRNFGYGWGFDNIGSSPTPGSETYRGSAPFSEPETQALRDFEIAHHFELSVYYHAYANIFIFPWGFVQQNCPDNDLYRAMGDTVQAMCGYQPGLVADLLYLANGGSFDWEYGEQTLKNKILGITIEAGRNSDGFWPTLARLAELKDENLQPLLFLTRMAGTVDRLRPPSPPVIAELPGPVSGASYSIDWSDNDLANPGVRYELVELQKRRVAIDPGNDLNSWGTDGFSASTARSFSTPGSLYSGTNNQYLAHLTTAYPYLVKTGDHLTFRTFFDMELFRDFGYVSVSTDGRTFTSIPGNLTSDYNPYGPNRGNGITGSSGDWVQADFDLSSFVGQQVWFKFTYETDFSFFGEGWYLDNIYPHVVFDSSTVVNSNITALTYDFTDKPLGVYYYQVRAQDAEGQWGDFSTVAQADVLGTGTGDIDLDGIANSPSDLALFSLYFRQGISAYDIDPAQQVAETDINCDGFTSTPEDLISLARVVAETETRCYSTVAPPNSKTDILDLSLSTDSNRTVQSAVGTAIYAVKLENTVFPDDDSVFVDIALTQATTSLLGYQFHLEYDAARLELQEVRAGDATTGWQFFDWHSSQTAGIGEVVIASVAQYNGSAIDPGQISLLPIPAGLVHLKFRVLSLNLALSSDIRFVWSDCGDNAVVCGSYAGSNLQVDSLALSREVRDYAGADITGLDPLYGGANQSCFYELFGNPPAAVVDFANTRIVRSGGCCVGQVGDVNGEGGDAPTIGDISRLIDHLFISGVELTCLQEADVNQSGGASPTNEDITIGDISMLIDHLFVSGVTLPSCL